MLEQVKAGLGITGTYQDNTIQTYIDEVISFLIEAGVSQSVIETNPGIVIRGVADLWNYGSGSTGLSPYFMQRASQLAIAKTNVNTASTSILGRINNLETITSDHEERIDNQEETINTINTTLNNHEGRITNVENNKADTEYVDELVGDIGDNIDDINGEVVGDDNG